LLLLRSTSITRLYFPFILKETKKKEKKKYIQKKKIPNSAGAACLSNFPC
jgi:hypothetical protein